jgi:hypothetical protein
VVEAKGIGQGDADRSLWRKVRKNKIDQRKKEERFVFLLFSFVLKSD